MTALDLAKQAMILDLEADAAFRFYEAILGDPDATRDRLEKARTTYRATLAAADRASHACVKAVLSEAGRDGRISYSDEKSFRLQKEKLISEVKGNVN